MGRSIIPILCQETDPEMFGYTPQVILIVDGRFQTGLKPRSTVFQSWQQLHSPGWDVLSTKADAGHFPQ